MLAEDVRTKERLTAAKPSHPVTFDIELDDDVPF
jgi:hypothetical protein